MLGGVFGLIAAGLQLAAYAIYIRTFLSESIRPNAASWLMFAYGTALLVFLEAKSGAGWEMLALPIVCAVMSIAVALMCLRKNATDPVDNVEKAAFSADVILTAAYFGLNQMFIAAASLPKWLLVAGNVTTLTAFIPILRSTWKMPEREGAAPWILWTSAYACLTAATLMADRGARPELLLYPVLSMVLHGAVAAMSFRRTLATRDYVDVSKKLYIAQSTIEGAGLFSGAGFAKGERVWRLHGAPVHGPVDPTLGPNWIGIGFDLWIDPDRPLDSINHSCNANTAFGPNYDLIATRPISPTEEVTLDYSTTEADPRWAMECACGAANCRKVLRSIQVAYAHLHFPPAAAPAMQMVWRDARQQAAAVRPAFPQLFEPAPADEPAVVS